MITPNLRDLVKKYTSFDNFYADAEVSMQGHSWLTSSFVNDYLERMHLEDDSSHDFLNFRFDQEAGFAGARPGMGNFFMHLIKKGISFTIYGEAAGVTGAVGDAFVANHLDLGVAVNDKQANDIVKAEYVANQLTCAKGAPAFTYVLLPRDHTERLAAGQPSPVSLIAENDQATGLLIQRLSEDAELWRSTVVFLVEDDSLQGYDHVDYHRTICVVASPWAKPGHNSHMHASFPAIFRTIEKIFGIGPMNRFDANAPVLWDAFTATPTPAAYSPFQSTCAGVPFDVRNPMICESPEQEEEVEIDDYPDDDQLVFRAATGSVYGNRPVH